MQKSTASSSQQSGEESRAPTAKLSSTKRLSLWQNLVVKMVLIIKQLENVERLKVYLGDKVYKNLFPTEGNQVEAPKEQVITRILDGEIVGRQLAQASQSKKPARTEPALCPHPVTRDNKKVMIRGGNQSKTKKWWTCRDCHTRWERKAMTDVEGQGILYDKHSLMVFGKYTGMTFSQVEKTDQDYCKWVIKTYETEKTMCEGLTAFAEYLLGQEWEKVKEKPQKHSTEEKLDMELDDLVEETEEEEDGEL